MMYLLYVVVMFVLFRGCICYHVFYLYVVVMFDVCGGLV